MIELAGCVIRDTEGKLLLLHRNTEKITQWELPGGKIEPGEDAKSAAIREVAEELDIDVRILRELGKASFVMNDKEWMYRWYEADILGNKKPRVVEDEFDNLRYWHLEELKQRDDLSPNVRNLLADETLLR